MLEFGYLYENYKMENHNCVPSMNVHMEYYGSVVIPPGVGRGERISGKVFDDNRKFKMAVRDSFSNLKNVAC